MPSKRVAAVASSSWWSLKDFCALMSARRKLSSSALQRATALVRLGASAFRPTLPRLQ